MAPPDPGRRELARARGPAPTLPGMWVPPPLTAMMATARERGDLIAGEADARARGPGSYACRQPSAAGQRGAATTRAQALIRPSDLRQMKAYQRPEIGSPRAVHRAALALAPALATAPDSQAVPIKAEEPRACAGGHVAQAWAAATRARPVGVRTFQGQHYRRVVGHLCVVHSPAELVSHPQRLRHPRDGVVESWDARL